MKKSREIFAGQVGKSMMRGLIRRTSQGMIKALVRTYQVLISSWMPPTCRFYPSCSRYMIQAVDRYGPLRGTWLGLKRLSRCHPWNDGGYDPLPEG